MKKNKRPRPSGTMHLYRVFVVGETSEVYDERFIFARNEHEAYRYGVGKGLTKYAYETTKLAWTTEAFDSGFGPYDADHLERLMEYIRTHTIKENVPFWVPNIDMETEKVPSDNALKGENAHA